MKIAVAGATGKVAGRAVTKLLETNAQVTVLVRHPEKLPEALRSKVTVEQGSLDDAAFVTRATRGVDALFWMTPPTFATGDLRAYALTLGQVAAGAIKENRIPRVVFLSSHAAERPGFGPVSYAGEVERLLDVAAPNTVALRAAAFMENLFQGLDALKNGMLFGVPPGDKKFPLVATRDIGDVAAKWLLDSTWTGHQVRGVHGPVDITSNEQAEILTKVLGKPVRYQQVPATAVGESFLKMGAPAGVAQAYTEMVRSFGDVNYRPLEERSAETTTPTALETFARDTLLPALH